MPHTITLSGVSWSTPDGRTLFQDIDLSFGAERTGLIGRNGVGKSTLVAIIAGDLQPSAGTVSFAGTLGCLRQSIRPDAEGTIADLFGVRHALGVLCRAERGEASAEELVHADWTLEGRMIAALERLGLSVDPETPLASLSGGQQTRAALAALVFTEPDFILLDEPTNSLDRAGRAAVAELLHGWKSGAIVVSHDRELLEEMDAIIELTTLGATRYGGNWSHYVERKQLELAAAEHDRTEAEKQLVEINRRAQQAAERQARRDSVGGRKGARGDMPAILAGGLKRKAEETGAATRRLMERRRAEASETLMDARERIERLQPLTVRLPSTGLPDGRTVLVLEDVTFGYDDDKSIIEDLDLAITGPQRVALTGPNGSGKSTLLALVAGSLQPWSGRVSVPVPFAMLDQQVSILDPELSIRDNFRHLNPEASENECRAALARFMFRADAALSRVGDLSGGEILRAGLAAVLGGRNPPQLLILDEPTNHLDIFSIEAIESGLSAYDGALLVVSHDETFLENIGITHRVVLGSSD